MSNFYLVRVQKVNGRDVPVFSADRAKAQRMSDELAREHVDFLGSLLRPNYERAGGEWVVTAETVDVPAWAQPVIVE